MTAPAQERDSVLLREYVSTGRGKPFEALVLRHGGLVMGVCMRILNNGHDAEDAAQAVFLTLARRAGSLLRHHNLAGWLHRVARHIAARAARDARTRGVREQEARAMRRVDEWRSKEWEEVRPVLDGELEALPERFRVPMILFHLEGRSQEDIAGQLNCSVNTVATRLHRGRLRLRDRLRRRGVTVNAALIASSLSLEAASTPVTNSFAGSMGRAAANVVGGRDLAPGLLSAKADALSKGAMNAMTMVKLKVAALLMVATGAMGAGTHAFLGEASAADHGHPVPLRTVGEKPESGPATAEKDGRKAGLVNGLLFEPLVPEKVWLARVDGMAETLNVGLRVTNKSGMPIRVPRYPFSMELRTGAGKPVATDVSGRGLGIRTLDNYPLLENGRTMVLHPANPSVSLQYASGWRVRWGDGFGMRRSASVVPMNPYRISFHHRSPARTISVWDAKKDKRTEIEVWQGAVDTDPVPIWIVPGSHGQSAEPFRKAVQGTGELGCLVVRSETRRALLAKWMKNCGWADPVPCFKNMDFNRHMIVCFVRRCRSRSSLTFNKLMRDRKTWSLGLTEVLYRNQRNIRVMRSLAVLLPKSEIVKATLPRRSEAEDTVGSVDQEWLIGPEGGDMVDGLQGFIEAERERIKTGDDIKLTFSLKVTHPTRKDSIHVWDNKYSSGYRNDAYIVRTPDGKEHLLRRPVQLAWEKNVPSPVEIKPGKPWKLGGWAGEVFVKSLKELRLDTRQPGTYWITGLYMERGGEAPVWTIRGGNEKTVRIWGGNIATSPIRVEVGP